MMTTLGGDAGTGMYATGTTQSGLDLGMRFHNVYKFECFDADGNLKWSEEVTNLVTDVGANDLLTNYFKGSAYTAAWYVGLASGASPTFATGDTAASHSGFTEYANYSQSTRPAWTGGTASARAISNSASQAVFSINGAGGTVGGAFLISNSTISGTTGILYGEATLTSARTLASGDTLNITVSLSV
jgi:hypothetical protein